LRPYRSLCISACAAQGATTSERDVHARVFGPCALPLPPFPCQARA
jgi:hypothetical protein